MLVIDSRNPQAVRVGSRLSELLPESVLEAAPHIVVGGDGFLLRTAAAGEYTGSYLGLNTGNLGFLLNDVGDIEATAKAIAEGQYGIAPADQWERLRFCESTHDYEAVSPSGLYRGAYQFDFTTWQTVGGTGDPAAAPPEEQDARARELYARRGAQPWPECGRFLD